VSAIATIVVVRPALLLAVFVNPFLIVRQIAPRTNLTCHIAWWGLCAAVLNLLVPVGLHASGIVIGPYTLAGVYWVLFGGLAAATALRRLPWLPEDRSGARALGLDAGIFALLVIPYTYLAGFDTYKWQDLATNVRVTGTVPWLVHPIALLGFVPRSYPSAQPLLLSVVEILGGLGVDWGFYVVSLVSGISGLFAAAVLGRRLLGDDRGATWFGWLYLASPVFVIHNHWATGRGLFVSILPLFIESLIRRPRASSVAAAALSGAALLVCHKVGMAAAPAIPMLFLASWLLPRWNRRATVALLLLPSLAAALALAPRHGGALRLPTGLAWNVGSRFGLLVPLAVVGLLASRQWLARPAWRCMLLSGICLFPFACAPDMYGALLALPFVTFPAVVGLRRIASADAPGSRKAVRAAAIGVAALALVPLGYRLVNATSPAVRGAARFLEAYDPRGPFRLAGPSKQRRRMQAYVSGCPRFVLRARENAAVTAKAPPWPRGFAPRNWRAWVVYGRYIFGLSDVSVLWYGRDPRVYYIVLNGEAPPAGTRLLFRRDSVALYAPKGQRPPLEQRTAGPSERGASH